MKSTFLTRADLLSLANAYLFAEARYLPLDQFVTVSWLHCDLYKHSDNHRLKLESEFIRILGERCRYHGIELAYILTRERKPGSGAAQTHVLAHLGTSRGRIEVIMAALRQRFQFRSTGLHVKRRTDSAGLFQYTCKAIDPDLADEFSFHRFTDRNQGVLTIPRCGLSQNLNRRARRNARWREITHPATLRYYLDHPQRSHSRLPPYRTDRLILRKRLRPDIAKAVRKAMFQTCHDVLTRG